MHELANIQAAKRYIETKIAKKPDIAIILGSGLGALADEMTNQVVIPYLDIPHFAASQAVGHANELVIGELAGKTVLAMKGRYHYYEGYSLEAVTFPVRVIKALGIETLIITNASGAVNESFSPGELMLITDHINLVGTNPLIGPNNEALGPRFPDVSAIYSKRLGEVAEKIAAKQSLTLQKGVYTWCSGPAYETPAEVRMIRTLGGDAVGMSTVPEAIIAAHSNMEVLGISCLTNMASGILAEPLSHEDVVAVAARSQDNFIALIRALIGEI